MRINVRLNEIRDTFEACDRHAMRTIWYIQGYRLPHYPVPALIGKVSITDIAVYIHDPKGWDNVATWSAATGNKTVG